MLPTDGEKVLTKYAEPMVGGGALFFSLLSKYDFEELYISDINAELINAYQAVKNDVNNLIAKLNEMQMLFLPMDENGRKYFYYTVRERFNSTTLTEETATEKAAQFIFLNKTCFNGLYRVNRKGQFNVPMGAYKIRLFATMKICAIFTKHCKTSLSYVAIIRCQNRLLIKIRLYISIHRIARFLKHPLLPLTILMRLTTRSK